MGATDVHRGVFSRTGLYSEGTVRRRDWTLRNGWNIKPNTHIHTHTPIIEAHTHTYCGLSPVNSRELLTQWGLITVASLWINQQLQELWNSRLKAMAELRHSFTIQKRIQQVKKWLNVYKTKSHINERLGVRQLATRLPSPFVTIPFRWKNILCYVVYVFLESEQVCKSPNPIQETPYT